MIEKLSPRMFVNKVLAGTATGIIIGLIPNAVLGAILKYFDILSNNYYSIGINVSISYSSYYWCFHRYSF